MGSLVQIIQCEKGTLGKLIKNLNIHPALKKGFNAVLLTDCTAAFSNKKQQEVEKAFQNQKMTSREFLTNLSKLN